MPVEEMQEDRDAIYYPFIHFRNEAWLRSALLFFPHVLRMAPACYRLNDSDFVSKLAEVKGRRDEPLVGRYPLDSAEAYRAGDRLAERFAADVDEAGFSNRYSQAATQATFKDDSLFQIHRDKFSHSLIRVLEPAGLVWQPKRRTRPRKNEEWLAVHPSVGEAIMSTAAAAAVNAKGYDIVTDNGRDHVVTAARDEQAIYDSLLQRSGASTAPRRKPSGLEIGNMVIATTFDLSAMKPADFAKLSDERAALFELRKLLADRAAQIPAMSDDATRQKFAKEAADEIVTAWERQRMSWKNFAKRLFRVDAAEPAKDAASDLLGLTLGVGGGGGAAAATAAAGATAATVALAAVPGLAVGFVLYGLHTRRSLVVEAEASSTRFLSRIGQHGGILAAAAAPAPVE